MGSGPCLRSLAHWYSVRERGTVFGIWNISHNVGGALVATFALYGLTQAGFANDSGGVFRWPIGAASVQPLYGFGTVSNDIAYPIAFGQGNDGALYGVSEYGGPDLNGGIFSLHTNGASYKVVHSFTANLGDGGVPVAGMILGHDGSWYGTTSQGGSGESAGTRTMFIVTGLISIAFGVVITARPGIGAVTLALLFGLFSLIYGVSEIVTGVQMRRTGQTLHSVLQDAA